MAKVILKLSLGDGQIKKCCFMFLCSFQLFGAEIRFESAHVFALGIAVAGVDQRLKRKARRL